MSKIPLGEFKFLLIIIPCDPHNESFLMSLFGLFKRSIFLMPLFLAGFFFLFLLDTLANQTEHVQEEIAHGASAIAFLWIVLILLFG